jgi:hypothetical protein
MKFPIHTKLIFLDMDGVVNCQDQNKEIVHEPDLYCPEIIEVLNGLSEIPDIKIVLSSVWRFTYDTPEKVNTLFKEIGLKLECVGVTPSSKEGIRGVEIYKWIRDNIEDLERLYNRYVIIDDDSDMLLWQAENFFKVDSYSGITPNVVYRIKRFFKKFEV